MKKWMAILGVLVVLLGAGLAVGCRSNNGETGNDGVSALPLTVTEPLNETTVYTADLVVKGQTESDAVVSVNEEMVDVGADGKFSTTVTLEEGPNPIEVLASDFEGNEGSVVLTVIYVKQ